jgi:hypothetical protein
VQTTYRIVRMYKDTYKTLTVARGLTLEEAQEHCKDPETSSRTAKLPHNVRRTKRCGPWFDGYEEE